MSANQWRMLDTASDVALSRVSGEVVEERNGIHGAWLPSKYRNPVYVRIGYYYRARQPNEIQKVAK